ncbi:MAG TPA: RHS repeat-associated core domain-containing protein, partial [Rugosimonospora sp.]|nr:RHS repeat-associated core domain-containing protein [Rugosimonospora sp.]
RLAGTSGAVTDSFTYEPRYGRLATATNALGKTSSFAYDDGNGTITATDPLGRRTTTTILAGQPVTVTDPLGNTTYISYLDGLPVAVADPLGRVATVYYDAAGRPVRRTDPLGDTTRLAYDSVNQVTSLVDPLGSTTRAGYDADGNRLTLTDANGNVTTWTYDRMGRALTRTDALSRISRTSYDLLGEAVSTTDQKGTVDTFAYDALGRLTSTGYGTTSTVTTAYDSANRPTSIVDSTGGTLTQTYDGLDRLTKQVSPQGTVSYGYDKGDRRTSMTVAGQPPVSYAYDTADQLTSITQGTSVTRIGYDAGGQRTSLTLPNGLVTSYGYDAAGQLLSLRYAKGTTAAGDLAYGYDAAGRRTSESGSLARVSLPTAVTSATYDAANQLTKLGSATFTYDADGQLTGDGASTYTWNDRNELAGITGAVTASFGYDALGRRTSRTVGTASTGYLYDGPDAVQELNGSTPTANMVTGLGVDETYQRTDASGVHYPIADALGSVVAQTDATGAVQTGYTYEPFGKTTATGAASSNSSQFTGRENDGTGLYYYRARYYSPAAQRFISADPAGEAASGTNLYAYTGDSPTNATDPSGLILPLLAALAGECALGALEGVAGGLIVSALTGRKYTLREGLTDAATGCAANLVGLGIEKGLSKLKGLGKAADVCLHSFTGDTPVLMADGSDKPIGSVRAGDRVRTTDPATGRPVTGTVSHVYRHEDVDLTDVTVRDRAGHTAVVHTTTHHRFWDDARHEWVEAGSLAAGEHLRAAGAGGSTVVSVRSFTGARVMYDLTVDRVHTFYVAAGDTTVLVHNCDRQLWQLTREGASATKQGGPFNTTFFKSASDGTWWTTDVAGHGESAFKVYQETSKGLEWIANATKYGDYMTNQWKSSVGRFIPWSMLS